MTLKPLDPPCGTCPDRGCGKHANCEAYLDWDRQNRERREAGRTKSMLDGYSADEVRKSRMTVLRYRKPYR